MLRGHGQGTSTRRVALAVVVCAALAAPFGLATSSAVAAPGHVLLMAPSAPRSDSPAALEAKAIAAEARDLQRTVVSTLGQYERAYGRSLPTSDRRLLAGLVDDADRALDDVVTQTDRWAKAVARGPASRAEAQRARAQASWARAQIEAEASLEQARAILEPRMSLIEKLAALGDYTELMDRFEDLGERIDTFDAT